MVPLTFPSAGRGATSLSSYPPLPYPFNRAALLYSLQTPTHHRRRFYRSRSPYPTQKVSIFERIIAESRNLSHLPSVKCSARGDNNHHHHHHDDDEKKVFIFARIIAECRNLSHLPPVKCSARGDDHHHRHHDGDGNESSSHHHHCHHSHHGMEKELTGAQMAVLRFAKAVRWADLADFLREHLQLCCCSMALLLAAAASPYVLPKPAVRPFQDASIFLAFPLVGVSSAFDATMTIAAGKVNIHVLMALAAFASVFMGNSLEGSLLLAMFNLAHIAEEYFTSKSMIDVKELKENHPEFALVLNAGDCEALQISKL